MYEGTRYTGPDADLPIWQAIRRRSAWTSDYTLNQVIDRITLYDVITDLELEETAASLRRLIQIALDQDLNSLYTVAPIAGLSDSRQMWIDLVYSWITARNDDVPHTGRACRTVRFKFDVQSGKFSVTFQRHNKEMQTASVAQFDMFVRTPARQDHTLFSDVVDASRAAIARNDLNGRREGSDDDDGVVNMWMVALFLTQDSSWYRRWRQLGGAALPSCPDLINLVRKARRESANFRHSRRYALHKLEVIRINAAQAELDILEAHQHQRARDTREIFIAMNYLRMTATTIDSAITDIEERLVALKEHTEPETKSQLDSLLCAIVTSQFTLSYSELGAALAALGQDQVRS